ncbi:hypothetical protein TNCV_3280431 [Trichonephila clavipes]|nr:hypothetical protein TNCV_3280431 [Trichonephila clavipes]
MCNPSFASIQPTYSSKASEEADRIFQRNEKDIKNRVRACRKMSVSKSIQTLQSSTKAHLLYPMLYLPTFILTILDPYPSSKGYKYCFTIIDRYTRRSVAWKIIPLEDMLETTARTLLNGWISRSAHLLQQLIKGQTFSLL